MKQSRLLAAALLVLCSASGAFAQGFINPFVATTLTSPSKTGSATKPGFGVALGGVGGFFGGETEIAYYPNVIDNSANGLSQSKVVTFSGNTLIGPKIGPVKIYGAIGAGSLYLDVTGIKSVVVPDPKSASKVAFTVNAGGGAIAFFGHLGIRADLRYTKAYGFDNDSLQTGTFKLNEFDFWRANGGIVLKF